VDVHISLEGRRDLSGEIYRQLRQAVLDGLMQPGDALPPSRELAKRLAVSRTTVSVAYDRLWAEGFVTSRAGAGTFIAEHVPLAPAPGEDRARPASLRARPVWEDIPLPRLAFARPAKFDFRTGLPDASFFPFQTWRALLADQLRSEAGGNAIYGDPGGFLPLREAIARHIAVSRGVVTSGENVVITNGTQQALDVIVRTLLGPGDTIAVEDPGYAPPQMLFRSLGLVLDRVPVDRHGLDVERLSEAARVVYVTPSHQYPLGMSMSLQRRLALLAWAEAHNAAVVEDDYDSEFRFGGRPIEPLQTLDRSGRVIYVGSFSKTLLPTLRLGFIVSPPSLTEGMLRAKYVADWHSSVAHQVALARFIDSGGFARHIRRLRTVYEARHDLVRTILQRDFPEQLEVIPSAAGLHITALARPPYAARLPDIIERASLRGVEVHELARIAAGASIGPAVMIGFGAIPTDRIAQGLALLRESFQS
jgi:GntR family transcriptional regulator/MocR family aminotransferase